MKTTTKLFAAALLACTSNAALAASPDGRIEALESQLQDLSKQVEALKAQAKVDNAKAQQANEAVQVQQKAQSTAARPGIANGRLSISSADGDFTAAIRALFQMDMGYYMQQHAAAALPASYGPDLSSGTNLRRIFLGLQGKVFGDWSYYFLYDFGGATTETPGHIMYAYLQYDGLAPWAFRAGAYAPPLNLEDSTASADLLFFERNSPSNLQRNIAGAEGRAALSVLYTGERLLGAVSLSGDKIGDGAKAYGAAGSTAVANYDEQIAVLGRLSYLPVSSENSHWIVGINGLHVFKLPDLVPNGGATLSTMPGGTAKSSYSLGDLPEITVDSNGAQLVSTGALPASHITSWGVETAANYQNVYGQAGYYGYQVSRLPVAYNVYSGVGTSAVGIVRPSSDSFTAWYVQGSWILTGESRIYSPSSGSFAGPKVARPLSFKDGGGWGAFELALRYSDLNLNSHANDPLSVITGWTGTGRSYTYYNTVRGGEQKILTAGLNWYPNQAVRFALDYQYIDVSRLQVPTVVSTAGTPTLPAANGGQTLSTLGLRFQLSI